MGFASNGEYLLVISHSGRGLFSTRTWKRVARDSTEAYPTNGCGIGIGPIDGIQTPVAEMDFKTEKLSLRSPDGSITVEFESGTITLWRS